jgi:nucleoside-diphosphate-sugar epimerase
VVAVTDASGPVGRAVVAALREAGTARPAPVRRVIAVDDAGPAEADAPRGRVQGGVLRRRADLSAPGVAQALAGAEVVVHIATGEDALDHVDPVARRIRAVRSAQAVSTAAAAVGAERLIVVTSAMVLGARPDNPVPLPEGTAARAEPDAGVVGDLVEVERVLERVPRVHPGLALTLLRPAALVGPGVDTLVTRHFEAPRLLVLRGHEMSWQFCHLHDLASAVVRAVTADLDGALTVGSPGVLPEAEVERISGRRRLEVPPSLAFSTAERLHRVGVLPGPAGELAFVVHPWAVPSHRLVAAGWSAGYDNEACLRELLALLGGRHSVAGRRLERRDAAMGAAGAAVALMGTAALLRQARSRRERRRRT